MKAYKIILLISLFVSAYTPSAKALTTTTQTSSLSGPSSDDGAQAQTSADWYMAGANPQRTSWVSTEVRGDLKPLWYTPIEPYINPRVQVIATGGKLYVSTAKGLYSYNADTGSQLWVYPTKFPIAASPTVIGSTAYIGVFDRHIHAVNTDNGQVRWISDQAGAGFDTSPLVVNNKVVAGNRDGYMYAFDITTGKLLWKFKTDGPILFSAAYYDGKIYFVSSDMHAFALNESGGLVWKSVALPGSGFNSWWPVVYQAPGSDRSKDRIIISGGWNYREDMGPEYNKKFTEMEAPEAFPSGKQVEGAEISYSEIANYYNSKPYRKTTIVLNAQTGAEMETAPFLYAGTTNGSRFPAMVDSDGRVYQQAVHEYRQWIPGASLVGWKPGETSFTISDDAGYSYPADEPMYLALGGKLTYFGVCCDRYAMAFDTTNHASRWSYWGYDLDSKFPGYSLYYQRPNCPGDCYGLNNISTHFGTRNGSYGIHGEGNPPIPYNGKVYLHRGNTLLAFAPSASSPVKNPKSTIVNTTSDPVQIQGETSLKNRLAEEVQKMLDAGHLRKPYINQRKLYCISTEMEYWQNSAMTIYVLLRALPHLPSSMQPAVRQYIQNEYNTYKPYEFESEGFAGAPREFHSTPPDALQELNTAKGSGGTTLFTHYASWKYAQVFGDAPAVFNNIKDRLSPPPSNAALLQDPSKLNEYIAGYLGYLELQKLATGSESASVRNTLDNLISLRTNNFTNQSAYANEWESDRDGLGTNCNQMNVASNFLYLVPELAEILRTNNLSQVQAAITEDEFNAPFWFVAFTHNGLGETTLTPLYDVNAVFQAKALILRTPASELEKYLDASAFKVGDLYHILNLTTVLGLSSPSPSTVPNGTPTTIPTIAATNTPATPSIATPTPSGSCGTTNIALNRPATSSSNEIASFSPNQVVDGQSNTRWASSYSDPQWVQIDLGSPQNICRVRLSWETAYGSSYQIQVSNDATNWSTIYSTTTGNGGVDDLTGLSGSGRYVRMLGTARATSYGYSLWDFEVFSGSSTSTATPISRAAPTNIAISTPTTIAPTATSPASSASCGTTNIALNRPATSSSNELLRFTPNLAVDGQSNTRWASSYSDPQWVQIDLGSPQSICRVRLSWEAAYGSGYQIQVSNDAANWTTIYSTTTGNGGVDDLTGLSGSGRYVRMFGTARATSYGYSLWDFEVFSGSGTPPTTPVSTAVPANTALAPTNTSTGPTSTPGAPGSNIGISNVADGGSVAKYDKQEVTFSVTTSASNPQLPFDPSAPNGVNGSAGVSVDGVFTSPTGKTWIQPGFYYQIFDDQVKGGSDWFYPTGQAVWKVRFSPDEVGTWQYYIKAQDKTGIAQTQPRSFTVTASSHRGFIRPSKTDPRYFEYADGTYFPALGVNAVYEEIQWKNPSANQEYFQKAGSNGIQVVRTWLTHWAIFGSSWNPWYPIRNDYDGYLPRSGVYTNGIFSTPMSQLRMVYADNNSGDWFDACRFIGGFQAAPAVKQNTKYHIKIRYKAQGISGPRDSAYPGFGFVAKVQNPNNGNWHTNCYNGGDPQNGVKVTGYGKDSANWTYLEGEWNSGNNNTLPMFYLALENVNSITATVNGQPWNKHPEVDIDTVFIGEDMGGGNYGPNIVTKPSMEHLSYYMERNAYAFDKVLTLAEQNGVYFKLVVMEKNELLQNEIGFDGNRAQFDNNNFYGNYRSMTPVRWYQQAWWRYLQARWGYSPNIFAFEAVNEAAPAYTNHYGQVDEMGKYLHCGVFGVSVPPTDGTKCDLTHPNAHMVSTSFWAGFERGLFANSKYLNVDFADIHKYIPKDTDLTHFQDTALSTYDLSMAYGALASGSGKPIIRGETALTNQEADTNSTADLSADKQGIWIHKLVWGGINPGGLIENYWDARAHIFEPIDFRSKFKSYYLFIKDIPLSNGKYVDASAVVSSSKLRAWGQKDLTNQRAHLWIANTDHIWTNTASIAPINGTVTIKGLAANASFNVEWWDTYAGKVASTQMLSTNANGDLVLTVSNLTTDVAVRISGQGTPPINTPTATLQTPIGTPGSTSIAPTATSPAPSGSCGTTNIALNRPATSSSNELSLFTPNLAVDGQSNTRWASSYSDPQWIQVDLGSTQNICRVRLSWETAYGSSYQIQVSNDATNWTTIYSTTRGDGGIDDLTGLSGSGRYVRMFGTARATSYGYSLWDFEVYSGSIIPAATPTLTNTPLAPTNTAISIPSTTTTAPTATSPAPSGSCGATNIALNRSATSSSNELSRFTPNLAVDGNSGTRWSSSYSDPQWVQIDLGSTQSICRVRLNWEAAYGSSYQIQVSNDAANWTTIYSTTTGNGGVDDLTGLSGSGRYVRMLGTTRATSYGYSLWDFEVYSGSVAPAATPTRTPGPTNIAVAPTSSASTATATSPAPSGSCGTTNIALNRPATSSSNELSLFTPNQAVDGQSNTRWSSSYSDPQWVQIDLGSPQNICRVRLNWETAHGSSYQIQVSNDATNWTTIYSTTTGNGGVDDLTGLSGSGRYVRMLGTTRATSYGYSLWDFEVYSNSGAPAATPALTNTPLVLPSGTPTSTTTLAPTVTATPLVLPSATPSPAPPVATDPPIEVSSPTVTP